LKYTVGVVDATF